MITGTVTEVKVGGRVDTSPINKDKVWEGVRHERKTTQFDVSVRVQYCNRGEATLIIPTTGHLMPAFVEELKKTEPSRVAFAIIEPDTCYESADRISVKSGYKLEERVPGDKFRPPVEVAIPEYLTLRSNTPYR